jgi:CBS domain containing-hemolysin-like protein
MKNKRFKWILTVTILTFFLTILFSILSDFILSKTGLIIGIITILVFILLGVVFDMIGVAVASATDRSFHAMASKKVKSTGTAKNLIKNSSKVSSICNDVIGDICNIMSGTATVVVSNNIAINYSFNLTIVLLIVTSIVASLTIGLKAWGKDFALKEKDIIIMKTANILSKKKTR